MMYTCKDEFNKKGGWESKAAEAQHLYTPQKKKKIQIFSHHNRLPFKQSGSAFYTYKQGAEAKSQIKRKQIKNKMWKQSFHPLPVQIITLPRFCCLPPTSFSTSQPMHAQRHSAVSHCSPFDKKKKKIKWDDALLSACRGNVSLCLLSHTFFSFWVPLCCCCCFFLQQSRPLESPDPSNSISPHPVLRRTRGEEGGRTLGSVSSDCRLGEGDP